MDGVVHLVGFVVQWDCNWDQEQVARLLEVHHEGIWPSCVLHLDNGLPDHVLYTFDMDVHRL